MPTCDPFSSLSTSLSAGYIASLLHSKFFQHYIGTTPFSIITSCIIIAIGLYFTIRIVRFVLYLLSPFMTLPLDMLDFRRLLKQQAVFLELIPPAFTDKSPYATYRFITNLHSLYLRSNTIRHLRRKSVLALEIAGSREGGVRYIARLSRYEITGFKQAIKAYQPDIRIEEIEDYIPSIVGKGIGALTELIQARHFSFPLADHDTISEHDPIATITSTMTQLAPDELMIYQLVITPSTSLEVSKVHNQLLNGEVVDTSIGLRHYVGIVVIFLLSIVDILLGAIGTILGDKSSQEAVRHLTPQQQRLVDARIAKVEQPMFQVDIRTFVMARDGREQATRLYGLNSALYSMGVSGFQRLVSRSTSPAFIRARYQRFKFIHRLPSMFPDGSNLLAASEVASLYHFSHSTAARTEGMVKSYSKTLPVPTAIQNRADTNTFDVVLGQNYHQGKSVAIGLTAAEREHHAYIVGGTGNGKTTLMEYAIVQDIRNGKGVAVIDPHGESAKKLLKYIPKSRLKDVVYFNPRDLDNPIGLNLLELPLGLSGSELAHAKDQVTEAVLSVLSKIFDNNSDTNAYRIERILRKAIHTAFTTEGATLFTVLRLLTEAKYRKQVVKQLKDERLIRFWKEELDKAGEMQRVKISSGPVSRIERYEDSESARRVLGQSTSTIHFSDIMDSSKILICNFSKGGLGEDTSTLFGITVLAMLQLAAMRRDEIAEDKRIPFYLYVDEFQNVASDSFMDLFSEARKYKLYLTMAQQSVSQLKDQAMLNTILDNVGTIIAFRSKSEDTEKLLLHQFGTLVDPGEIPSLPVYNFYIRIAAIDSYEAFSGKTLLLDDSGSEDISKRVIKASRKNYTIPYKEDTVVEPKNTSKKGGNTNDIGKQDYEKQSGKKDADTLGSDKPESGVQ